MSISTNYFLGIDPDLHTMAYATVTDDLKIFSVGVFRNSKGKGQEAVLNLILSFDLDFDPPCLAAAVEGQELYAGQTGNNRDILHLAQAAGMALFWSASFTHTRYFPKPSQWKGNVPKGIHHRRILAAAGIPDDQVFIMGGRDPYCGVKTSYNIPGADDLNPSDWKHITDAIGLAQYAAKQYQLKQRTKELFNA